MSRFVSSVVNAIGSQWCQLMHPDPMWPVKGEYQCRVCLRSFLSAGSARRTKIISMLPQA